MSRLARRPTPETDRHAWLLHQAWLLRLLATSLAELPDELDLTQVAAELELAGRQLRLACEAHLLRAMVQMVKLAILPDAPGASLWAIEAAATLSEARQLCCPSIARTMVLSVLWGDAVRTAVAEIGLRPWLAPSLPPEPPWQLDALVAADADPWTLTAQLAARLRPDGGGGAAGDGSPQR